MKTTFFLVLAGLGGATALILSSSPSHSQAAGSFVALQANSPGTTQSGNVNFSGNALVGGRLGIGTLNPLSSLHIAAGNIFMDSNQEIYFADDGQIRSHDDNHRILFRRDENKLELREFGDIVLSSGSMTGAETAKAVLFANGNFAIGVGSASNRLSVGGSADFSGFVGIGTNNPDYKLDVRNPSDQNGIYAMTFGPSGASDPLPNAIWGDTSNGDGVYGSSSADGGAGVFGVTNSESGIGVSAFALNENGTSVALQAASESSSGYAGVFLGRVDVQGHLSKAGGSFKIDHPLDPANKYLYHSFVESPDMKNIYDGVVITDARGYATIVMPDWFDALNTDFRYQLTTIDTGDSRGFVMAKVVDEIRNGVFRIRTSEPRTKVSWQVTGIRNDAYARAHRIPTEVDKSEEERGYYLYPIEQGKAKELGIGYRRLHRNRQ